MMPTAQSPLFAHSLQQIRALGYISTVRNIVFEKRLAAGYDHLISALSPI
jgi:hypothetical protein